MDAAQVTEWCYLIRPTRTEFLIEPTEAEREAVATLRARRAIAAGGDARLRRPLAAGAETFGIVVLEGDEEDARRAMEEDPAVLRGVMTARLQPFRIALLRGRDD